MVAFTRSSTKEDALQHVIQQVLGYEADHVVHAALQAFDITDIDLFLFYDESEFLFPFHRPATPEDPEPKEERLSLIHGRRLYSTILWYLDQPSTDFSIWYSLTPTILREWQQAYVRSPGVSIVPSASTPASTGPTTSPSTFRHSVKVTLNDYPKLKEDKGWRVFNRLLRTTAAHHDTLDVLDPTYVPPSHLAATFEVKQLFMFNMFTQCIHTGKGKVCVRANDPSLDAQRTYAALREVYEDDLSVQLLASSLRSELTILKLDDKWRSGCEAFLTSWTSKVQELENIEDRPIDDATKRIWLTTTLRCHPGMNDAVRQATTTELTIGGISGSQSRVTWSHFYTIITNCAKFLDLSHTENSATQRRNHLTEQHGRRRDPLVPPVYTKNTGPNMKMTADMKFENDVWRTLTSAQQDAIKALRKAKKPLNTSRAAHNSERTLPLEPTLPPTDVTPVSADITPPPDPGQSIRAVLSTATARTPSSTTPPSQISHLGRTYTLINACIRYQSHSTQTSPVVSLLLCSHIPLPIYPTRTQRSHRRYRRTSG
jgi:hypothetical protein